ncbi:MAG: hypothetical protein R3279_08370 [Putridiphycobacter sp.]|nr:hypothetical protein [Putridiphycobacter sp.]
MSQFSQYFAIEKKIKQAHPHLAASRSDLIYDFTNGKKNGLTDLTPFEYREFIAYLNRTYLNAPQPQPVDSVENKMRRKIIAILKHQMGYSMMQIESWCLNYGKYHKGLNQHNYKELVDLVSQVERYYQKTLQKG